MFSGLGARRSKNSTARQHVSEVREDWGAGLTLQATQLARRADVVALQEASTHWGVSTHWKNSVQFVLCTSYLLAGQVTVTVSDLALCCFCVHVTSLERLLTPFVNRPTQSGLLRG